MSASNLIAKPVSKHVAFSLLGGAALVLVGCSSYDTMPGESNGMTKKTVYEQSQTQDIVDTAVSAGSFNTLATALTEAGLVDALKGTGPFTVFAPTDEAFAKIPADDLEAILADKDLLTSILTYHVVSGKVMANEVVTLDSAPTLQGQELTIASADGVTVNDANVIKADVETSNGVIHVIDKVLVPQL